MRAAFDYEMNAGHESVMRKGEIGSASGSPESDRFSGSDDDLFARHRPSFDFEDCSHSFTAFRGQKHPFFGRLEIHSAL